MSGKGDRYRPVNHIKYDKGYYRMVGRCLRCERNSGDKCSLEEHVPCLFVEREKDD